MTQSEIELIKKLKEEILRLDNEVAMWKDRWEAELQAAIANEKHYDKMLDDPR